MVSLFSTNSHVAILGAIIRYYPLFFGPRTVLALLRFCEQLEAHAFELQKAQATKMQTTPQRVTLHNGITSTVQYHYPLISVGDKATAAQYALTDSAGYLNYIFFI